MIHIYFQDIIEVSKILKSIIYSRTITFINQKKLTVQKNKGFYPIQNRNKYILTYNFTSYKKYFDQSIILITFFYLAGAQSDQPSGEVQRPNIIQQGIQNFQDTIVKPVQQLFNPPQVQPAKPIVEAVDVPVVTGSNPDDDEVASNDVTSNIINLDAKEEENDVKESSENEIIKEDDDGEELRNVNKVVNDIIDTIVVFVGM